MYEVLTLNKIAQCGLENLDKDIFTVTDEAKDPDAIILRSFKMHDYVLGDNLKCVARAGAGTNNIPIDKCSEKGIVVFNTPGANANAVVELTIAGLLLSSRKIYDSINWANTLKGEGENVAPLVEKGKGAFAGPEIMGKKLAVAGGVAANSRIRRDITNAAAALGAEVYMPPLSLCGDNAAMIGAQGYYEYLAGNLADMSLNAYATKSILGESI